MVVLIGLVLIALFVVIITRIWNALVHRPHVAAKLLRAQGIDGPEYKLLVGSTDEIKSMKAAADNLTLDPDSHDFIPRVMPHYRKWQSLYGKTFMYWFGPRPVVLISDPELAKQILVNKTGVFGKLINPNPGIKAVLGRGLPLTAGAEWLRHRKVLHPAFTMDKIKTMTKTMAECGLDMIQTWEEDVLHNKNHEAIIEMSSRMSELTADVISHTAFGSSYKEGIQVFKSQEVLIKLAVKTLNNVPIPGFRYIPTRRNLQTWHLERKIRGLLMQMIEQRIATCKENGYGNDLLGLMLEACMPENGHNNEDRRMSMDEIIGECKTFFFAGQDTTSHLLTWAMFLLSKNPEWQERLREEVLRECGMEVPSGDMINKLNLVTMVLYETLRLYGAVSSMQRITTADVELGGKKLPKGTGLVVPVAMIHRDKAVWGTDVNEFNPWRFQNGVTRAASHPSALLAFSVGPRHCIGQDFAMMEAKTMLTIILQRFSFSLSTEYIHAPKDAPTLLPKHGLPIVLKKWEAQAF